MSVKSANRNISALQSLAQEACNLFMAECKRQNVRIFITETHRSQARQDYLYAQGRTRPGNKVTWTRNSNHKTGWAWDIAVSPPKALYDSREIARAGKIAGDLGIEWGGTWRQKDTPHFQIDKNWKSPKKAVRKNTKTKFLIGGKTVEIDGFLEDGRTYVIARPLLELLGHKVGWDNLDKKVVVDGKSVGMVKKIVEGRIYSMARPMLESLGYKVGWDGTTNTVTVTK